MTKNTKFSGTGLAWESGEEDLTVSSWFTLGAASPSGFKGISFFFLPLNPDLEPTDGLNVPFPNNRTHDLVRSGVHHLEQASDGLLLRLLFLILFLIPWKYPFFELPLLFLHLLLLATFPLIISPSTLTKELIFLYTWRNRVKAIGLHVWPLMNDQKLFVL